MSIHLSLYPHSAKIFLPLNQYAFFISFDNCVHAYYSCLKISMLGAATLKEVPREFMFGEYSKMFAKIWPALYKIARVAL